MPQRILILFAHPALEKSRVNRVLVRGLDALDGVTFHDLYEAYPDMHIDVAREQQLLTDHDVVIFHHPFFWYSTPAILKEWQDLVLVHGWAFGREGTALRGKVMFNVLTSGGRESTYTRDGYNRVTIRELLAPMEYTALLCGMDYLPPFGVHGTLALTPVEIESHARDYRLLLEAIRDDRLDIEAARRLRRINLDLDAIVTAPGGDD